MSTTPAKKPVRLSAAAQASSTLTPSYTVSAASSASIESIGGVPLRIRLTPGAGWYSPVIAKGSACPFQPGTGLTRSS